ncbi:putative N-terminal amidase [Colletotrichum sublineola]|uniref:Putative N-terminal amidase n=1 Tax=Colletotrichum sublineola TaxID=1173701 RepID=A0A066X5W3_COLSU|nr:putative N-terminal amidase [Colletotrichum sublineola]
MRIGCLQFAPQVGDVNNNLNRADAVLSRADPDGLDLLVLPELAFTGKLYAEGRGVRVLEFQLLIVMGTMNDTLINGYNFTSLQHIAPYLEHSGSGITSLWARTTALKYNCNLVVGYPEKVDVTDDWPASPEYYNSALVVNEDGETIANYRKSHLYYTDETWALEGEEGFYRGHIPGLGRTSIGICMDINPYKFEAPWHAYEFAFHVLESYSNLVILSMAWLTRENAQVFTSTPNEPDMDTLTYWVARLEPLIRENSNDEIIVVLCNRSGIEDNAVYAGTSAVLGVQNGEVKIYGILGRGEKKLLVVDTNDAPYAKLVHRPESEEPIAAQSGIPGGTEPQASSKPSESVASPNKQDESLGSAPPSEPSVASKTVSIRSHAVQEPAKHTPVARRVKPTAIWTGQEMPISPLRSPGNQSINLPTPTAPSPTPFSTRPKLTIPVQSSKVPGSSSPAPKNDLLTWSPRSLLSDDSDTSCAWIPQGSQYVGDNELLNRYLASPPNRPTFDGQTANGEACFSPITPFDEMAPSSLLFCEQPSDHSAIRRLLEHQEKGLSSPVSAPISGATEKTRSSTRIQLKPIKHRHSSVSLRASLSEKGDASPPWETTLNRNPQTARPQKPSRSETRGSSRTKMENNSGSDAWPTRSAASSNTATFKTYAEIQGGAHDRLDTSSPQSEKSHSSLQHLDFTPQKGNASARRSSRSGVQASYAVAQSRNTHRSDIIRSLPVDEDTPRRPSSASQTNQFKFQHHRVITTKQSHRRTRSSLERDPREVGIESKTSSTTLGNTETIEHALRSQRSDTCLSHEPLALRQHQQRPSTAKGQVPGTESLHDSATYYDVGPLSSDDGRSGPQGDSNPRKGAWNVFEPRTPKAMLGLRDEPTTVG